ncbi:hypothetical protein [Devosia sp. CAU 1758]
MARVPNSETPDHEARRFLESFDRQVAAVEQRDYVYPWTTNDDEVAEDAIIVGIGGTSAEMLMAGLSYVEPAASIYWCARVTTNGVFEVGGETQAWDVPAALTRAHFLRSQMGYERVVVTMAEAGIWRPEWGQLAEREGL